MCDSFYCGAVDDDEAGTTRCMLNVGFRNVKAQGNFEYKLKAIGTTFKLHFYTSDKTIIISKSFIINL